jgi:surface antigen
MKRAVYWAIALCTGIVLNGCSTYNYPTNEDVGMVIGGSLGGLLGSQVGEGYGKTAATIVGTMAGAYVGGAVGRSMDTTDRLRMASSLETVRTGVPSTWRNPDTGNSYAVTSTRTYDTGTGPCREYVIDATVDGRQEKVYGTACRSPDGSWVVRN